MARRRSKNLSRRRHEGGDGESAVGAEAAAEEQSWLGPYPVTRALPRFENLDFRELRGTMHVDQAPMSQKELDECAEMRREVRGRIQQARKAAKRKTRREKTRKKRRMAHERNTLDRRALGLLSHRVMRRSVEQRGGADNRSPPPEEMATSPKSMGEDDPILKGDDDEEWEDSDDEDMSDGENSDDSGGVDGEEDDEHGAFDGMEYDDASGELVPIPRKWGKWFKLVRKDDEDGFSREFPGGMTE